MLSLRNFFSEEMPNDANAIDLDGFQNIQVLGLGGCNFTGKMVDNGGVVADTGEHQLKGPSFVAVECSGRGRVRNKVECFD